MSKTALWTILRKIHTIKLYPKFVKEAKNNNPNQKHIHFYHRKINDSRSEFKRRTIKKRMDKQ